MPELTRRARGPLLVLVASALALSACGGGGKSTLAASHAPVDDPTTSIVETTTTTELPTTTTTAAPVTTTTVHQPVVTTPPTTSAPRTKMTQPVAPAAVPCSWTYDLWVLSGTQTAYLHLTAYDRANVPVTVVMNEAGTTTEVGRQVKRTDGVGHVDLAFVLKPTDLGKLVDVIATFDPLSPAKTLCDPSPHTMTLNPTN